MSDKHRITFDPVDIEMEVGEDEYILDAAFRQGIHLMHGCREGRCSACKSYVLDGEIQMENYSTFACNEAEVDEGYVLLCRSTAYSDCTVELLNFDEDELLGGIPIQDVRTRVTALTPLTRDIVSLRLQPIEPATFEYKPGQYADLTIPGTDEHRSFSMASTQTTPDRLEFLIKKYPGGKFAELLENDLSIGDEIELTGPYGSFTLKEGHILPIVCIGGGAGMAPILSLLRHMSETGNTRPVHFYYGARTAGDLFYLEEILERGERLADFHFVACLSESAEHDLTGAFSVEPGNVTDVVGRLEPDIAKSEVYLCGPPPMVDAALALLDAEGTPPDQIFYDKFTSPAFD
ncbi:2Fe-2S iron-sulfur cluster binding domain-containing protein [Nocardia farcinica]|uniref:Methane monooxygenase component C n=1 Tax=Nocardia farcinica TaxID=37329 RepID=A0A0H5NNP4_NOCFR|nr:2Fe-2S iron-sulfur cluster-binding protein [Nocardia farcinica]AXK85377.1 CDP-6-deoxy-delta-3,4-glucoseen reductase [Nocardia farcinica]MBA4859246.1 2Fe-2S iron-sulfur cluster binding domain-containing protein [Nocardia farcinica]MBC9819477.1 2Fe-2S iron-sulfur cluster binding domain-containing protein [Nocardia farcinica]MBF6143255.1 2Fe-2S iron-sulfur cluster binding domain-containing protein [Nocardia farcinica]MBF6254518.1 2Fe-2S iron-sulfur cluster binding domain-containing protein [No